MYSHRFFSIERFTCLIPAVRPSFCLPLPAHKKSISQTLGYGFTEPLYSVAPPTDWGGQYKWREYNPEKAKELIKEAGYDGEEIFLMAQSAGGRNDMAEAITNYLKAVGFNVTLDLADVGRHVQSLWNDGWKHLTLSISGQDTNYLTSIQRWWGWKMHDMWIEQN
ncbi:MAG TPA: hypothetical protein GXZ53_04885 [Firmicutes bacterium]|nr:hypothetical protein [Bacillota bacterium]